MDRWISLEPITLSNLSGCLSELRQMCKLKLSDGSSMDAVCVESLEIRAVIMGVPKLWVKYLPNWSLPISETLAHAPILVGSDCHTLHTMGVVVKGDIVCTGNISLMASIVRSSLWYRSLQYKSIYLNHKWVVSYYRPRTSCHYAHAPIFCQYG